MNWKPIIFTFDTITCENEVYLYVIEGFNKLPSVKKN